MIWVILNFYHDNGLLPFFLRYYRERGVERVGIIDHSRKFSLEANIVERVDETYQSGSRDNELLNQFRSLHLAAGDYYIPADLDEFFWTPGLRDFKDLFGYWDYIPAKFIERITHDGSIPEVDPGLSLDEQFPMAGRIIKNLCAGCDDKVTLVKAQVPVSSGHHYAESGFKAPFTIECHHFKFAGGAKFWEWMNFRESLATDDRRTVPPFRQHLMDRKTIDVFNTDFGIYQSPRIGI